MGRLPAPRLVIEVFDNNPSTFGPDTAKCRGVIWDAATVGWSWYSRFPANAFWTLRQGSPSNDLFNAVAGASGPGLSHVRIWYMNDATGYGPVLVFNGRMGEPDQSGDDVIWTAWSYLAELALSRTGYNRMYANAKLSSIVNSEWSDNTTKWPNYGAKVQGNSLMAHIATGSIQVPQDATGTFDITVDAQFGVIDISRLLLMFDLSEIGRANTTNNVTFEFSRSITPTFNFWKNKGTAQTARSFRFPGVVRDFRFVPGVLDIRNDLATIGIKSGQATEIVKTVTAGNYGITNFGRRQDAFTIKTLAGYKNIDDDASGKFNAQTQITQRAVNEASQLTRALRLDCREHVVEPFDGWDMEDTVPVAISRGMTAIDAPYRIVGAKGVLNQQGYSQALYVSLPTA